MSGTNKVIVSAMQKSSESAITSALENANEVAKKEEGEKKDNKKK